VNAMKNSLTDDELVEIPSKKRKEPETEDLPQDQKSASLESTEIRQVKMPKIQYAQKCAWCGRYLFCYDEIGTYDGDDPDYQGWMVHESCNLHPSFTED
jgi:hypothetical protein